MPLLRRGLQAIRHPVSQNALALNALSVANLVVPLVTLPYTARVLGSNGFGLVAFGQSLSFVLGLVIAWGFDLWASRDVAVLRDDPDRLSALVAKVTGARLLLAALALIIAAVVLVTSETTRGSPGIVAMAWLAAAATGITPTWFFIGMERLRLVSSVALALRVLAAVLTFVLVHNRGDAWIVMALFTAPAVLSAGFSIVLLLRSVDVVLPRLRPSLSAIRGGAALFAGTAGLGLYTSMNVVILGFLGTRAEVAHFSAGERILRACMQLLTPVTLAMYPRLAALDASGRSKRALRLLFTGAGVLVFVASVWAGLALLLAPQIIAVIYGPQFHQAAAVLRLMAPIMPIFSVTMVAATWLMVKRKDSKIVQITMTGGLVNLTLAPILVHAAGVRGMAISVTCAELAVMTMALAVTVRSRGHAGFDQATGEDSAKAAGASETA